MTALLASGDFEKAVCRVVGPHGTVLLPLGVALFLVWLLWHESIGSDRLCARRPSAAVEALPKRRLSPFPRVYDSVNCGLRNARARRDALPSAPGTPQALTPEP